MSRCFSIVCFAAACLACSSSSDEGGAPGASGFDIDEPPGVIGQYEGKADDIVCARYPGGTLSGDDLLVLVNKAAGQQLASSWAPKDVLGIEPSLMMPGRTGELRGPVVEALREMFADAASSGLKLGVRSAYRSFRTQCITFDYKVQQHGLEHAKQFSAEPGRSQHQLGTTADITAEALGWKLSQSMGGKAEGQWLAANAHRFGFALSYPEGHEAATGYAYEPWHYRYIGRAAALEMFSAGLILEEYLSRCAAQDSALTCEREKFPDPIPNNQFIGGPCTEDSECASIGAGATCLQSYPDGACTLPCDKYCPDRSGLNSPTFCVGEPGSASTGQCHSRCDEGLYPGGGCRPGYSCVTASRPDNSASGEVCMPTPSQP